MRSIRRFRPRWSNRPPRSSSPPTRARAEDYSEGFGLTEHELALIKTLPAHSRWFLVRQPNASVVVRLDLGGAPEVLTVLSGREASVRKLDNLRAELGDDPAAWYPRLTGHAWPGDAGIEHYSDMPEAAE